MKELAIVGIAAGVGGVLLGKFGGPIESKIGSMVSFVPAWALHFVMVGGSAVGVYYFARRVL